jgi:hypothetical protein
MQAAFLGHRFLSRCFVGMNTSPLRDTSLELQDDCAVPSSCKEMKHSTHHS